MHGKVRQKGITLIGMIIVMAVLGFFIYVAMKLIPTYVEYSGVVKSMQAVARQPNAAEMDIEKARRELQLNFNIQYVEDSSIPPNGIKMETANGAKHLHITYDKIIPFAYNVSLLVHFDHSEDMLKSGSGY